MYKVAIIQNDSEMMRYSWADIRPMIHKLGYAYDGYTSNDIASLYQKIDIYDAIIIATNACNDSKIKNSLDIHASEINTFLSKGKGLLVLFQMKKDESEFFNYLQEDFRINTIKRSENLKSGDISINDGAKYQQIVCYPNRVNVKSIKNHCLTNKHVNGLYWTFLQPQKPENYNVIIEDPSYTDTIRPLMISSRGDFPFRIIVSAIALDWQAHEELWENTVKYVCEGKTHIGLITKIHQNNYDFRYLQSWLKVSKIPTHLYQSDLIPIEEIEFNIHSVYIVDPTFSEDEISQFISAASPYINIGKAEIIFFNEKQLPRPYIALVSNVRHFNTISTNAIIWIKNQFPENHGYFAKSFWNTLDVLNTFTEFDIPTDQYKDKVLSEIAKHDRGGNYDEVLGASCAMLEIYNFYLGKEDKKTKATLKWIIGNYKNKVLFERASALDILVRLNRHVAKEEREKFKEEAMDFLSLNHNWLKDNEFSIYRYCQTLYSCGYIQEAKNFALKFTETQNFTEGKWVNISHTAAIVELLIKIWEKIDSDKEVLEEMIFKGVEYLYGTYNSESFSWNNEVLATAKSLKALKLFEDKVSLPVDVIKNRIFEETIRINSYSAITLASDLNLKYLSENNLLKVQMSASKQEIEIVSNKNKKLRVATFWLIISIVLCGYIAGTLLYIAATNNLWSKVGSIILLYLNEQLGIVLIAIGLFVISIIRFYLTENNLMPTKIPLWLKKYIAKKLSETESKQN